MTALSTRTWLLAGTAGLVALSLLILQSMPSAPPMPMAVAPLPAQPMQIRTGQVVALRDIPRGSSIEAVALGISPVETLPAEGFARIDDVAGRVALERIARGEPLTAPRLSPRPDVGGLAPLVPVGQRAVTLRVADDNGISFLIRPGDRVDVALATRNDPDAREGNRNQIADLARMLIQDIEVLAIGDALSSEPAQPNAPARNTPPLRNVTLAATPDQFLMLGLVRSDGGYVLGLRNPLDRETPELDRATRRQLVDADQPVAAPASPTVERAPRFVRTGPEIIRGPVAGVAR